METINRNLFDSLVSAEQTKKANNLTAALLVTGYAAIAAIAVAVKQTKRLELLRKEAATLTRDLNDTKESLRETQVTLARANLLLERFAEEEDTKAKEVERKRNRTARETVLETHREFLQLDLKLRGDIRDAQAERAKQKAEDELFEHLINKDAYATNGKAKAHTVTRDEDVDVNKVW